MRASTRLLRAVPRLAARPHGRVVSRGFAAEAAVTPPPAAPGRMLPLVAGLVIGGGGGFVAGRKFETWWKGKKYMKTMAARLPTAHDEMTSLRESELIKKTFSSSDIKGLFAALPKDDITLWEFKNALKKLQSTSVRFDNRLLQGKEGKEKMKLMKNTREINDEEALRIFRMFDLHNTGKIHTSEFVTILAIYCSGTEAERAELLFKVWDTDGDGVITREEMKHAHRRMPMSMTRCKIMTSIMFQLAKNKDSDRITLEEFKASPKTMHMVSDVMMSSNYMDFLNKENFPAMATAISQAYEETGVDHRNTRTVAKPEEALNK